MEAVVVNFKRGLKTMTGNRIILKVEGVFDRSKAKAYLNKKVSWTSSSGKIIKGEISKVHGNSGCLLAKFERGLPGQVLGKKVIIE